MKNYILTGIAGLLLTSSFTASASASDMECSLWPVERYGPTGVSAGQRAIDCVTDRYSIDEKQVEIISINEETSTIIVRLILSDSTKVISLQDFSSVSGEWL